MLTARKKVLRFPTPAGRMIRIVAAVLAAGSLATAADVVPAPAAATVTHLFTSWYGVEAGNAVFKVNRANVSPEDLVIFEQVKEYYKIELSDGESAPERVSVPTGVRLRAEVARKSEPWLIADKPWESGDVGLGISRQRVINENGLYRVWYCASVKGRNKAIIAPDGKRLKLGSDDTGFSGLCYMESRDAVHWVKPSLGLVEFRGSKDNNILTTDRRVEPAIFLDRAAPPEERYKSVTNSNIRAIDPNSKLSGARLAGAVSPDGIHWKVLSEPLSLGASNSDGGPEVHRDEQTGKYVQYMRANYPRRRSIARAENDEFRHWPDPTIILTPGPDEDPAVDFYNSPYLQYPGAASAHLMLVSSYHRDTSQLDLRMASSMDGDGWNWLSPRAVVELGKPGDWDGGVLYACGEMVRLPDGRVAVAINGSSYRHNEGWREKFERGHVSRHGVAWAIWEDGRIAGVEAEKAGEFTTLPLKATGQPIEVNARTGGSGSVQVDVLIEEPGRPYPKPALQARQMTGDLHWRPLVFSEGSLAQLTGKTIRLRFHLFDAKVFGVRGEGLDWVSSYARK
ncbi:MAG: hypothetical protein EXS39_01675 [Opitutaceae bacterium]|nr:hypothetical protein [Opitutaceae bacterium]